MAAIKIMPINLLDPRLWWCHINHVNIGMKWQQGVSLALSRAATLASALNGGLILVLCSSLWSLSWVMNAEQRGGMALNKDFRSKTGNGSVSREGRAIATPTGGSCTHIPPSLLPSSIFIYFILALLFSLSLCRICSFRASLLLRPPSLSLTLRFLPQLAQTFHWFWRFARFCGTTRQWINQRHQNPQSCATGDELHCYRGVACVSQKGREPDSQWVHSSLQPHTASYTFEPPHGTKNPYIYGDLSSNIQRSLTSKFAQMLVNPHKGSKWFRIC